MFKAINEIKEECDDYDDGDPEVMLNDGTSTFSSCNSEVDSTSSARKSSLVLSAASTSVAADSEDSTHTTSANSRRGSRRGSWWSFKNSLQFKEDSRPPSKANGHVKVVQMDSSTDASSVASSAASSAYLEAAITPTTDELQQQQLDVNEDPSERFVHVKSYFATNQSWISQPCASTVRIRLAAPAVPVVNAASDGVISSNSGNSLAARQFQSGYHNSGSGNVRHHQSGRHQKQQRGGEGSPAANLTLHTGNHHSCHIQDQQHNRVISAYQPKSAQSPHACQDDALAFRRFLDKSQIHLTTAHNLLEYFSTFESGSPRFFSALNKEWRNLYWTAHFLQQQQHSRSATTTVVLPASPQHPESPTTMMTPTWQRQQQHFQQHRHAQLVPLNSQRSVAYCTGTSTLRYRVTSLLCGGTGDGVASGDSIWPDVWECQASVIVLITHVYEQAAAEDYRYWPLEGSELYAAGHIEVHLVSEHLIDARHICVRNFIIAKKQCASASTPKSSSPPAESRTVTQFHFMNFSEVDWNRTQIDRFVLFESLVLANYHRDYAPIVVQSRDGLGSAGVYLVVDVMLARIYNPRVPLREFNVKSVLTELRKQCPGLVMSLCQYQLIFLIIYVQLSVIFSK